MGTADHEAVDLRKGDALIVVDVQNCFLPGGALGVPEGDEVVSPLNRVIERFERKGLPLFFSRDWHPPDHISFSGQGGSWPPHGIRDTEGAAFAPKLLIPPGAAIISKATSRHQEQYSAMEGHDAEGRSLGSLLSDLNVRRIFTGGLATDYCVLSTVLEALGLGFEVYLLADAVRAVNVNPGDGDKALAQMKEKGVHIVTTEALH
ncbi:MAG: isochorismatase family protein [Deltaproteobacteria bacterium]|nr:isochorismatase family protein [Deltaproteobacteria bacterium]